MAAVTAEEFFDALGRRGHEPLMSRASGTLRIELTDGKKTDKWYVTVSRGDVKVARTGRGTADCLVRGSKELFERLASGRTNPVVALLRGDLLFEGDWNLAILFQRTFPSPPRRSRRTRSS